MSQRIRKFLKLELAHVALVSACLPLRSLYLLIAIQYFHSSANAKALIPAADFIGLFLTPFILSIFANFSFAVGRSLGVLYVLAAVAQTVIFFSSGEDLFLLAAVVSMVCVAATPPLNTTLWQANVRGKIRGKLYGNINLVGFFVKTVSGLLISFVIASNLENFRYIALFYLPVLLLAAYVVSKFRPLQIQSVGRNPFKRFTLLKENKFIAGMLACWFLIGLSNLITYPLRAEYVAGGQDFPAYDPFIVMLLIEVIPNAFRMLSIKFWGPVFDRINFIHYRIITNMILMLSIVLFFWENLYIQILSAVVFGIFMGSGSIGWNLWLTKYVPKHQVTDYMSIHTFLTGVRGSFAPFLGFYLLGLISFQAIVVLAFCLGICSILIALCLKYR